MKQVAIWDRLYNENLTWKKETLNIPNVMNGKKVLELGAGNGKTLLSIVKQKPSSICAIDFSSRAIDKTREKFKDRVKFFKANAKKMPFRDSSFDVVVAYYILNNSVRKERIKIVKEIYRILRKKGICVFEDFSTGDFRNKWERYKKESNTILKNNGLVCHFFEKREVKDLFRDFSEVKIITKSFNPIRNSNFKRKIINCLANK